MPKTDSSAGRPRRSYQKLTERLRQFMEEGHFRDGDKLPPERALAESFGVSRSSVRVLNCCPLIRLTAWKAC